MLAGIWRNVGLHLFPRWTSTLDSPHHACILATVLSVHRILSVVPLWWNHFCSQLGTSHKELPKKIRTKRTLPHNSSSLLLFSPSGRPSRHWYCNERKYWVFFFLVVCVNERELVVIYRLRGGMEASQCAMSVIRVPLHLSPWIKQ